MTHAFDPVTTAVTRIVNSPTLKNCSTDDPDMTSVFDATALEALPKALRFPADSIRRLRNRLFKRFLPDSLVARDLSHLQQVRLHSLDLSERHDSAIDGASKLLFQTETGTFIETVILRIASGRTTLCLSSQVGCAAACEFCATGHMGIAQNLTAAQILDQVVQAGQLLAAEHRQLHNIVFMGMGEPFHNEQNLFAAIECLTDPRQFARSPGSLLISTVGLPEAMVRCAQRFSDVNLALSLHSVDQDIRRSMIPLAGKYQLAELKRALAEVNRLQRRPVMLEYLMLADVNDSLEQAQALAAWVRDLKVHINLIPFNPIADAPNIRGSQPDVIREFSDLLKNAGLKVTIRYSLGTDIAAACGQLVRRVSMAT
jgi:23S rRNA (adenine2503-C2)-methyltransferase